ncbi:hypothetical protein K502DRAFT_171493 [Neoconidiobolus thromboides FSU 785]|nr:hypothetical protein K502DRAFT_171493 [Neoconidiobolus thromboides FSU 785]
MISLLTSMFNILLLFTFYLTSLVAQQPAVYGGGCGIIDDVLYHVGGSTIDTKKNKVEGIPIKEAYSLNLKEGFKLKDSMYAPWKSLTENNSPIAHAPGVAVHQASKSIFMFGGMYTKSKDSFQIFDIKNKKWHNNQEAVNKFYIDPLSDGTKMENSFYISTFTVDDRNENKYYHYGGVVLNNNETFAEARGALSVFDAKTNQWSWPNNNLAKIKSHTAQFFKSKLFVLGGVQFENDSLMPLNIVMVFDLSSLKWENKTIKGEIPSPRLGLKSQIIEDNLIIVGGASNMDITQFPNSDIFILNLNDLNNLKWQKITINGFIQAFLPCLAYYNEHLIFSFGYHESISANTQLVNTKTWKLVEELPPNDSSKGNDVSKKDIKVEDNNNNTEESPLNLPAIIGGSIGGAIFILLIIILVWYLLRKKQNKSDMQPGINLDHGKGYEPPKLLQAQIWVDKPAVIEEPSFSLSTDTHLPDFDDDIHFISSGNPSLINSKTRSTLNNSYN